MNRSPDVSAKREAKRQGFTLKELLVVLAVICVLVLLLLPTLKVRHRSYSYRGRIIDTEWEKDLVSDDPAVRHNAVAALCEATRDKDRAIR